MPGIHGSHTGPSHHRAHSTYSSNFSVPAAVAHSSTVAAANNSAHEAMTESTPYLIMQQQQRDSALTKRQHSGAMESFFKVRNYLQTVFVTLANHYT